MARPPSLTGSFLRTPLNKAPDANSANYRLCAGACQAERPIGGGVQVSAGKWLCSACWSKFNSRLPKRT